MKLVKLASAYPVYLERFYRARPDLAQGTSTEQQAALDFDAFGFADFWKCALEPLGYQVTDILANAMPLQRAWAAENGVEIKRGLSEKDELLTITTERIVRLNPEILFLTDYVTFSRDWITELRNRCRSMRLVIGMCGAPFDDASVFEACDLVLTCSPELREKFVQMGHRSEHVNHAFDPRILDRISTGMPSHMDFTFVGQLIRDHKFHTEREKLLDHLLRYTETQIFSPSSNVRFIDTFKAVRRGLVYDLHRGLKTVGVPESVLNRLPGISRGGRWTERPLPPVSRRLRKAMQPPLFGVEMFQALHDSIVTLNTHINISPKSASNMRLYEATGVGTCLLTDWKENIHELFTPDLEVVTYRNPEECVEKVRWLLNHPARREEIARAGQIRTLKDHTFANRALEMDSIIRQYFG